MLVDQCGQGIPQIPAGYTGATTCELNQGHDGDEHYAWMGELEIGRQRWARWTANGAVETHVGPACEEISDDPNPGKQQACFLVADHTDGHSWETDGKESGGAVSGA